MELYLVYLNIKGTMVKLRKGMTDVSEKGNIASCLEPSDDKLCVHVVLCLLCVETYSTFVDILIAYIVIH